MHYHEVVRAKPLSLVICTGLSDLLSSEYGARFVFFVTDSANRIHVVHASGLKPMFAQLNNALELDRLNTTLALPNTTNSNTNSSDNDFFGLSNETVINPDDIIDSGSQYVNPISPNVTVANTSTVSARASRLSLELVNVVNVGARVTGVDVSTNGMYLFVTHTQRQSVLASMERSVQVCAKLSDADDPDNDEMQRWYTVAERQYRGERVPQFSDQQCSDGGSTLSNCGTIWWFDE